MANNFQFTQPTTPILPVQAQNIPNQKKPINYLKITYIFILIISLSSTTVLAYLNYYKNKIIFESNLHDYFYGNNDSTTLKNILQITDPKNSKYYATLEEQIDQETKNIRSEAIQTAREKALLDVYSATTGAAPSYGISDINELEKQISFTVPKGFSKFAIIDEVNQPSINIKSVDFKYTADLNFASGAYINIYKKIVDAGYQISNEDNEINRKYLKDFKLTTVGGKPAAYGYLDFETYSERYFVLNNNEKWLIYIGYGGNTSQEAENYKTKYKAEIDQFINSITFK